MSVPTKRATQAARVFACGDSFISGDGRVWWSPRQIAPWPARLRLPGFAAVELTNVAARRATTHNVGYLDDTGRLVGRVQTGRSQLQLAHPALGADTDLVVVSIGGNDAGFAYLLWKASRLSGRWDHAEAEIAERVDAVKDQIARVLSTLRRAAPNAMILTLGYPHVVPGHPRLQRSARLRPWWSPKGQDRIRFAADRIDDMTAEIAREQGVHFLDLRERFAGHEACGASTQWIRGPVAGWLPGMRGPSLHPTDEGHQHIAAAVREYITTSLHDSTARTPRGLPANPRPARR